MENFLRINFHSATGVLGYLIATVGSCTGRSSYRYAHVSLHLKRKEYEYYIDLSGLGIRLSDTPLKDVGKLVESYEFPMSYLQTTEILRRIHDYRKDNLKITIASLIRSLTNSNYANCVSFIERVAFNCEPTANIFSLRDRVLLEIVYPKVP
jgi:hypothetical protein